MSLLTELEGLGADVQDGMNRFMNNAALYEKMLNFVQIVTIVPEFLTLLQITAIM